MTESTEEKTHVAYVVEQHNPLIATTTIDGVWRARVPAWEHVMEALNDEKARIEAEEYRSGNVTDSTERLKIDEFFANSESEPTYYVLTTEGGYEYLGFWITEVQYHD